MNIPTISPPVELPSPISRFVDLVFNLHWTWSPSAQRCFALASSELWTDSGNPVSLLLDLSDNQWRALAKNDRFTRAYRQALSELDCHLSQPAPWSGSFQQRPIVYFCLEYGWHESLPISCGGLGILAGDHTKTASDLGLNFIGIGLLYRQGFFVQQMEPDGRQTHIFPHYDVRRWPIRPVGKQRGRELMIQVEFPGRVVRAKVWLAQVGRAAVLLLDSDVPDNHRADRAITSQLYCRGREMRLCQERLIAIGGVRVLRALRIRPAVWHLNEGHCVFLQIERLRERARRGIKFHQALSQVAANTVFTTHTPVAAGNEQFDPALVKKYFEGDARQLGISFERLHALALEHPSPAPKHSAPVNLTALAIQLSSYQNGVSKLNAQVENRLWRHLWKRKTDRIQAITNGVHVSSWLGPEIAALQDRHAPGWRQRLLDIDFWRESMDRMPGAELWEAHRKQKRRLIDCCRQRVAALRTRHSASPDEVRAAESSLLNPDALTIGFARRFAPYKRADLIFFDPPRLRRLLQRPGKPVQFIFAGKAHYEDREGQALLQRVFNWSNQPEFRGQIIFLEEYDMEIARLMVQGVDVWLNNPQRPLEASGTSGQKAAINGAPNCSILDGWWPEAYDGTNGWAIGTAREFKDPRRQTQHDAESLYNLIEGSMATIYHQRNRASWIQLMKASIATVMPQFNSQRMLRDYIQKAYQPAAQRVTPFSL